MRTPDNHKVYDVRWNSYLCNSHDGNVIGFVGTESISVLDKSGKRKKMATELDEGSKLVCMNANGSHFAVGNLAKGKLRIWSTGVATGSSAVKWPTPFYDELPQSGRVDPDIEVDAKKLIVKFD